MKKWTFSYHILLVAFVSLLASCSEQSDVSVEGPKEDAVKLSLIQSLDSINESISPTSTVRKSAQGTSLSTKDKITIAIADANGAYKGGKKGVKVGGAIGSYFGHPGAGSVAGGIAGAVVVGGLKSYLTFKKIEAQHQNGGVRQCADYNSLYSNATGAYDKLKYDSLDNNNLDFVEPDVHSAVIVDDSIVNYSLLTDAESKIGLTHNLMVAYLDGKIAIDSNAVSTDSSYQYVKEMFESEEFINSCKEIASKDQTSEESDLPTEVMDRFTDIYEGYVNSCDDVAFIIRKYIEVIEDSPELSQEDKENIKYGFATALYSTNYWCKELKEN